MRRRARLPPACGTEARDEATDQALLAATDQLAAFYAEPAAWYARPVVWITAGAAILAGTLSFFLLRGDDDPEPDTVVVPPAPR